MKLPTLDDLRAKLPRTADDWLELGPLIVLAAMVLLSAWVYLHVFDGEVAGDDNTFHYAEAARIRECLGHHDFDFWNPSANNGFATGYYYQLIPAFMPAFGSWLLGGSILWWFELAVFLPFTLAPIASYRGLRMMGATPWQAVGGAAAVMIAVGGSKWGMNSDGTFSVGLYTQGWALAAFPLAFGHAVRWIEKGESLGSAAFWSVFVGLCHPVAGVAIGLGLFAGEVLRWISIGVRNGLRYAYPDHKRGLNRVLMIVRAIVIGTISWFAGLRDVRSQGLDADIHGWVIALVSFVLVSPQFFPTEMGQLATALSAPFEGTRPLPAFKRLVILGALLVIGSSPAWLPVFADYAGYGGFPHRVLGEDGWHFADLKNAIAGHLLDENRLGVLTVLLPVTAVFARSKYLPKLWSASVGYFIVMMVGPYVPHGRDDPFPAIRVLGSMQVCLALAIGAGFAIVVADARAYLRTWKHETWGREALGAAAGILAFVAIFSGVNFIHDGRVRVAQDYPDFHREQLEDLFTVMEHQMQGRQQVRAGAEAHWSNLLPYVYAGRPAMLQMGGAALQSSPNYVYQFEQSEPERSAMIYDAPYVLLKTDQEDKVAGGTEIARTEAYELKEFPASGLVVPVHVTGVLPAGRWPARDAGITWLKSEAPLKNEVLAHDGYGGAGPAPEGIVVAYSSQPSPGDEPDYTFDAEASAPTTFEIKVSWHPRWHAFLDGEPVAIRRVTPEFMAIDVPKGRHHVAFRFDRPLWAWLVWLAWPLVAIAGVFLSRRSRPEVTSPAPAAAA